MPWFEAPKPITFTEEPVTGMSANKCHKQKKTKRLRKLKKLPIAYKRLTQVDDAVGNDGRVGDAMDNGDRVVVGEYNVHAMAFPRCLWPATKCTGKYSYTVPGTPMTLWHNVTVLLREAAYVVNVNGSRKTFAFGTHGGPVQAFSDAIDHAKDAS